MAVTRHPFKTPPSKSADGEQALHVLGEGAKGATAGAAGFGLMMANPVAMAVGALMGLAAGMDQATSNVDNYTLTVPPILRGQASRLLDDYGIPELRQRLAESLPGSTDGCVLALDQPVSRVIAVDKPVSDLEAATALSDRLVGENVQYLHIVEFTVRFVQESDLPKGRLSRALLNAQRFRARVRIQLNVMSLGGSGCFDAKDPFDRTASHSLGEWRDDRILRTELERAIDDYLRGESARHAPNSSRPE